jgi:hypothetical protein
MLKKPMLNLIFFLGENVGFDNMVVSLPEEGLTTLLKDKVTEILSRQEVIDKEINTTNILRLHTFNSVAEPLHPAPAPFPCHIVYGAEMHEK